MKRYTYILAVLCLLTTLGACTDSSALLDREDIGDLYDSDVFRNPTYARYFVNDIYFNLPGGYAVSSSWNGAYLDCATDNGEARHLDSDAHKFNNGNWNASSLPLGGVWSRDYAQIRACNKFLENYGSIETIEGIASRDDLERLRAETIFLRAFYYADLLKHFGGVPIVTRVLFAGDPELSAPRTDFAGTVEWVVGQCDNAARLFRSVPDGASADNFGRANEGTALALKAKVLLMAASPLFNRPEGYPDYDSADPNAALWRYPKYDRRRWNRAAEACKAVIDLGRYSLWTTRSGSKSAYETYFATRATTNESIFPVLKGPSIDIYYNNLPFEFMIVRGKGSPVCYNLPTWDLVAAYEMADGKLPEQEGSGYRPLNPFSGRDPRLEATVWHDGSTFCDIEFQTWRREVTSEKSDGKDYIKGYSRTGFFLRKYMDADLDPTGVVTLPNSYPIIRYADILLSYAEALNEYFDDPASAPGNAIRTSIDLVRSRAGMPGVDETFANRGWELTQENVRTLLRNERRVEFAFEEHRFWDVRRWMTGAETQTAVHELDIVLADDDRTKSYEVRPVESRAWADRMNLMPLPQSEINKNPNLVQNWGWSPAGAR